MPDPERRDPRETQKQLSPPSLGAGSQRSVGLSPLDPPQMADEIGRLGGYRILRVIGHGGMGVVYEADDPKLHRHVAIKCLLTEVALRPGNKERFLREARAMAAVEHSNVIEIYSVGEDLDVPFMVMPLLKGMSLKGRLDQQKPLPIPEVLRLTREICYGLQAAHERGLIHRDIKPDNIWLDAKGDRVRILDFGLVRLKDNLDNSQAGHLVGTPGYISPEQIAGDEVDVRTDLFSLGCMLYEMCTGQTPFTGPNFIALLTNVTTQTPKRPELLNPQIPAKLAALILRLIDKIIAQRPANIGEVLQALDEIQPVARPKLHSRSETPTLDYPLKNPPEPEPISPPVLPVPPVPVKPNRGGQVTPPLPPPPPPNYTAWFVMIGCALLLAIGLGYLIWSLVQPPPTQPTDKIPTTATVPATTSPTTTPIAPATMPVTPATMSVTPATIAPPTTTPPTRPPTPTPGTMAPPTITRPTAPPPPPPKPTPEQIYLEGIKILRTPLGTPDYQKALNRFEQAAKDGAPRSWFQMGQIHYYGLGVKIDRIAALKAYRSGAQAGDALAIFELGLTECEGAMQPLNVSRGEGRIKTALAEVEKLAANGDPQAQVLLGNALLDGYGVKKDEVRATQLFRQAAVGLDPRALHCLATCYREKKGGLNDLAEAKKLLMQARDRGFILSLAHLGDVARDDQLNPPDLTEAARLYASAADKGYAPARLRQGRTLQLLKQTEQARQALTQAREELLLWAEAGDRSAQYDLASVLFSLEGFNKPDSTAQAMQWLRRAAEQSDPRAQYQLSQLLRKGVGGERPDPIEARIWLKRAAEAGYAPAVQEWESPPKP